MTFREKLHQAYESVRWVRPGAHAAGGRRNTPADGPPGAAKAQGTGTRAAVDVDPEVPAVRPGEPPVPPPTPPVGVSPDDHAVPQGLRIAAAWTWRLLLLVLAGWLTLLLI